MMKKLINKFLIIGSLILILLGQKTAFCEQVPMDQYKQDYLQACKLIANKYIYLEQKLGISRTNFYQQCITYADGVDWAPGKSQFVREIRKLRSKFNDGHFNWELDNQLASDSSYFLGFIMIMGKDGNVYVGRIYNTFGTDLAPGDQILSWNGKDIHDEIDQFSNLIPQSTKLSSKEVATRRLTTEYSWQPLRDNLEPVRLIYIKPDGQIKEQLLTWQKYDTSIKIQYVHDDSKLFLTNNSFPSLEEIPSDVQYIHSSLLYFFRTIAGQKVAVLHVRQFYNWDTNDLDSTFEKILAGHPEILVIDLKDSAGGQTKNMIALSSILNIQKDFRVYKETIAVKTGNKHSRMINFSEEVAESYDLDFKNIWRGKTILRINSICGSCGDQFTRWFQLNKRGQIIGVPSAGRWGDCNTYTLKNTKTKIDFPFGNEYSSEDKSMEGTGVNPDDVTDDTLDSALEKLIGNN